ncbi:hypothetical protein [Bacillus wiedmannii]|uniref:hypothetical protein n=1 Tax=Bacillus wiedmannii TaxID=1890302 RepID=UPI000BFE6F11|nr:hypothetical protein [Bacillus wiedmannii]PHA22043.1 hypothetical protein COE59_24405 [Bacillus wiedmannii]
MRAILKTIDGSEHIIEEGNFILDGYNQLSGELFAEGNTIDITDDESRIKGIVNMNYVTAIKFEY